METNTGTVSLRDILRIIFRYKIIFLVLPIVTIIPAYMSTHMVMPMYKASVKLYVKAQKEVKAAYYKEFFTANLMEEHIQLAASNIVVERVVNALKLYEMPVDFNLQFTPRLKQYFVKPGLEKLKQELNKSTPDQRKAFLYQMAMERLSEGISAEPLGKDTSFFTISFQDPSPDLAMIVANSVSRSYIIFDLEQQIAELKLKYGEKHLTVVQLENAIEEVRKTLHGKPIPDIEALGPASVKIVQQAKSAEPIGGVNKFMLLIMIFFGSIIVSILLSTVVYLFDETLKLPKDIERLLRIPFLGSVPKREARDKKLITDMNPIKTNYGLDIQKLAEQTLLLMKDKSLKALLIASVEGVKESSVVIANIGICLAQKAGHKVLIIDANLRSPSMSTIFNISSNYGLVDVLEGKTTFEGAVQDLGMNLHVLPTDKTEYNPVTLINSLKMSEVIKQAKEVYEIILFDCSDLINCIDAVMLASLVDCTALVIEEGKVKNQVILNAMAPLLQKKVDIIGGIMSNRTYVIPKIIYKIV